MRIKFLSIIASFFMVSFVITSCLDNDNEVNYSPDATIRAFELDTIGYGVNYKFTIDQVSRLIYNVDSLPVNADTIINSILIKTLTTASGIVTMKDQNDQDSIVNINDSIDLTKYVNATEKNNFLVLKVWAPNMEVQNVYKVNIRMHTMVPDSLSWGDKPIAKNPAGITAQKQKLVTLGDNILLFTQNSDKVYSTTIPAGSPSDRLNYGQSWDSKNADLPEGADVTSIIRFADKLYLLTENKKIYNSNDGLTWTEDNVLTPDGATVTNLITSFSNSDGSNHKNVNGIASVIEKDNKKYFSFAEQKETGWNITTSTEVVPAEFPTNNLSADVYATESGTLNAIVVGNTQGLDSKKDTATVVWASEDGKAWIPMEIPSNNNCPKLVDPSIIHYNDAFYICGKETKDDAKGFQKFYTSPTLLVWKGVDRMFMLPGILPPVKLEGGVIQYPYSEFSFKGKEANYTMVVDRNHYIWMVGGQGIDKIWRGRVNKLGFLIQ